MSEKSNPNKNKYTYKYIQFTATPTEKKQIKHFATKGVKRGHKGVEQVAVFPISYKGLAKICRSAIIHYEE